MNVFQKVTWAGLKRNRMRTIVTVIGVILSAAMLTAVTTLIASMQDFMIRNTVATDGGWHVEFMDADAALIQTLEKDSEVEGIAVSRTIGYAPLEGSRNEAKPYLFIAAFDGRAFDMLPLELLGGRLPKTDSEILIPSHLNVHEENAIKIGDTITVTPGVRMQGEGKLGQNDAFIAEGNEEKLPPERFQAQSTKTYTVVGICARPGFEPYHAPGYTAVTKMNAASPAGAQLSVFTALKHPSKVYDFSQEIGGKYGYNDDLLRFMGISQDRSFNAMLYSLGAILILLIMVGSVLLIHNSFSISVSERTRQFGILSSVGATAKQLRKSVLFEGICIGVVGIPLGIAAGIGGIGVTLSLLGHVFTGMSPSGLEMELQVSAPAVLAAALLGAATILISAYIPARKAAKLPAIDAIRQTGDIKVEAKKIRTSKLAQRLFGLPGTLALKNFKRNKKGYRSTVISLFVSVVLFISASAFGSYLQQGVGVAVAESGYDIMLQYDGPAQDELQLYEQVKSASGVTESAYAKRYYYYTEVEQAHLTQRYIQYAAGKEAAEGKPVSLSVEICFLDDATYAAYAESLGLAGGQTGTGLNDMIGAAKFQLYDDENERFVSFDIFKDSLPPALSLLAEGVPKGTVQQPLEAAAAQLSASMPALVSESRGAGLILYAPYSALKEFEAMPEQSEVFAMTFLSDDPQKSADEMQAVLNEKQIFSGYSLFNIAEQQAQNRNMILLVGVFSYGFIVLISLITIANVFNTVSTNIHLRRREFAMLKSVGMTDKSLHRMLNYECLFYGLKALLYGLPAALAITYIIYRSVMIGTDVAFTIPWVSVAISIFSVFFVVFVTMLYAVRTVKRENTVDALKNDVL